MQCAKCLSLSSIWRPLFGPLRDWPLGLCDFSSLDTARDLIASDSVLPHRVAETFNLLNSKQHRWYYLKDQMPDEVLVFKSFDSKPGVATCEWTLVACLYRSFTLTKVLVSPHAAFDITPKLGPQRRRESVEVLLFVVYPENGA
jgi:hypothetical protein